MNWRNLKFIFKPKWWIMNEKYSEEWDKELNRLLDTEQFITAPLHPFTDKPSTHTVKLGDYTIWVSNFPYASFIPVTHGSYNSDFRASRLTIERAAKKFLASDNINFEIMVEGVPKPPKLKNRDLFTVWKLQHEQ